MSSAWMVFKQKPENIDRIAKTNELSEVEKILIEAFMVSECFDIEQFRLVLKELNISQHQEISVKRKRRRLHAEGQSDDLFIS